MSNESKKEEQSSNNEVFRALAQFSQIGVTMAASVFVGVFLGKYLDGLFGTTPWLLLIFSLLGAGAAIRSLFSYSKDKK